MVSLLRISDLKSKIHCGSKTRESKFVNIVIWKLSLLIYIFFTNSEFYKAGNYLGAISAYTHGLKLSNKMVSLYVNRSAAQYSIGNYQRCIEDSSTVNLYVFCGLTKSFFHCIMPHVKFLCRPWSWWHRSAKQIGNCEQSVTLEGVQLCVKCHRRNMESQSSKLPWDCRPETIPSSKIFLLPRNTLK